MTDPVLLENQIAIMSALVELAHAVGYGTKVRTEMITTLRERVQESERSRPVIRPPENWPPGMQRADGSWEPEAPLWRADTLTLGAAFWERTRKSGGLD